MGIINIEKEKFEEQVTNSKVPVVVDFWAPWCGYCRRISPVIDQLAEAYGEKIRIGKINIDEQPELAEQFEIETIPTLLLFREGNAGEPIIAPQSKAQVTEWLKENGVE